MKLHRIAFIALLALLAACADETKTTSDKQSTSTPVAKPNGASPTKRSDAASNAAAKVASSAQPSVDVATPPPDVGGLQRDAEGQPTEIVLGGVTLSLAADLPQGKHDGSKPLAVDHDGVMVVLRGYAITVYDARLKIDAREYGAVAKGAQVRLDAAGVHVDGALRGPLP